MLTPTQVYSALLVMFGLAQTTVLVAQVGTTAATSAITTTALSTSATPPPAPLPMTTQVVEWDVSALYNNNTAIDAQPGAIAVDKRGANSGLWFVTRAGDFRAIRLQPNTATKNGAAQWTSWKLDSSGFTTGGIKRVNVSDDGRLLVVRTVSSVQIVDTSNCWNTADSTTIPATVQRVCNLVEYQDTNGAMISDVALDRNKNVYTAIAIADSNNASGVNPASSQIEKLDPNTGKLTLWTVGGGAGNCVGQSNTPCLAGIAVHPKNSSLVYYSEPDPSSNSIAELNTCTNTVRRWSLTQAFGGSVQQPRQLNIDQDGVVWVVTGSGHLVSLDPQRNLLTPHQMPDGLAADPFGVAPDGGFVGYTASDTSKVGMLVPKGTPVYQGPSTSCVPPICSSAVVVCSKAIQNCGTAPIFVKTVNLTTTSVPNDGTYVEAQIDSNATQNGMSTLPLGVISHPGKAVGTFFYAVGAPIATDGSGQPLLVDRVGFVRLPRAQFKGRHEREDKDNHDDGSNQDDQDHDGIPNQNKTSDSNSHMDRQNDQLAPGQSSSYVLTAGPNTKALVATITANNPLAQVAIEIDDPNGIALALPLATPGAAFATVVPTTAGDYTVRVTNAGATSINHETNLLVREALSLP